MEETFDEAMTHHSSAVMFISQADPGFSESEFDAPQRNPMTLAETDGNPDGFQEFLLALRDKVVPSGSPWPTCTVTRTTSASTSRSSIAFGRRLQNFTRIETFGDHAEADNTDVQWVKVLIDPDTREVFAYQPQVVPGNLPGASR